MGAPVLVDYSLDGDVAIIALHHPLYAVKLYAVS
jgi:hypothetical protein